MRIRNREIDFPRLPVLFQRLGAPAQIVFLVAQTAMQVGQRLRIVRPRLQPVLKDVDRPLQVGAPTLGKSQSRECFGHPVAICVCRARPAAPR